MALVLIQRALFASCVVCAAGSVPAATISAGAPEFTVPPALSDPLSTLTPLASNQFVVPVLATGALNFQDWGFDLLYDPTVASPFDMGGLYQSIYQAEFAPGGQVSNIFSSGIMTPGKLDDVLGSFEFPVSGDGPLAFALFQYLDGQEGKNPMVRVSPTDGTAVPLSAPGTLMLAMAAIVALGATTARARRSG